MQTWAEQKSCWVVFAHIEVTLCQFGPSKPLWRHFALLPAKKTLLHVFRAHAVAKIHHTFKFESLESFATPCRCKNMLCPNGSNLFCSLTCQPDKLPVWQPVNFQTIDICSVNHVDDLRPRSFFKIFFLLRRQTVVHFHYRNLDPSISNLLQVPLLNFYFYVGLCNETICQWRKINGQGK